MRFRTLAIVTLLSIPVTGREPAQARVWGPVVDGLRIGVRQVDGRLEAAVQNTGKKDVVLNVGVMLANGRQQYPSALHVVAIDAGGRELKLVGGPNVVSGRLDPMVVPLPAGAWYAVPFDLSTATVQGKGTRLPPGKYQVRVVYEGTRVSKAAVPDMPGLALMNYREGRAQSAVLEYKHPPK